MEARAAHHSGGAAAGRAASPGVRPSASGALLAGYVPGSRAPGDPATGPSTSNRPSTAKGDSVEGDPDIVLLTLPANSVYLSVLRTATAGLAARLHFTLDEIEDLRIAVDEACAMLLNGEELPDSELHCRFTLTPDEIAVTVTLPGVRRSLPPQNTFAWQVLTALTGEVDAEVSNDQLTIGLVKRRSRAS
nr:hypothetical protein [Cryptosporangium aurantiacum]